VYRNKQFKYKIIYPQYVTVSLSKICNKYEFLLAIRVCNLLVTIYNAYILMNQSFSYHWEMYTIGYGVDETSYRIGCAVFKTSFLELT